MHEEGRPFIITILCLLGWVGAASDVPKIFSKQARLAYRKGADLLAKHGASLKDVVKITTYLLDTRECPNYHRARREAFTGIEALPAHTLIIVQGLAWPGMLVEVDMTAAIPCA